MVGLITVGSRRQFFILVPLFIIFGIGVVSRTLRTITPNVACTTSNFSGEFVSGEQLGYYQGEELFVPEMIAEIPNDSVSVLGVTNPLEKWIEIDLSEQTLRAWEGSSLFLETLVSTGLPWWPTPQGEFRVWAKIRAAKMEGGEGRYYYNLPNVPYVMYFENSNIPGSRGFGLHGTYWHNDFGKEQSNGCVDLPISMAEKLYFWVTPDLSLAGSSVFSSPENPGTKIVIHE
ncbi:hypothetical protein A2382_03585 [Candidatus Woesebacteria bacterium RIFOXYB1_FULL_38_16]|uniref:L,D-TPase catalytic domain-containing protein n=1 Tax=Candidatus Woesebacteria bacterium RIFOXYB1_FULL_38_16 TaxID=1802538 RepID=A0A1F8CT79_9BACT|nr:MAG: hypothetical protein A2382_03585 [Candidatus Woesebacteria bacterium RIFOXYB1_FULL_38_16]